MSVLIRGMDEIPEDGAVLVVKHDDSGKAYIKYACTYGYSMELLKIPGEHGRLIDADELKTAFPRCDNNMDIKIASVRATVNHMPTIIKAEGVEE